MVCSDLEQREELTRAADLHSQRVYAYIITTVKMKDGRFNQTGSAPNFQGGRITLCTCKHKDRATFHPSNHPVDPWKNVWVAGLTSKTGAPSRGLVFLMSVQESFDNFRDLWAHLPARCRRAKSASHSTIGDLYEPRGGTNVMDSHDPRNYELPEKDHVHARNGNLIGWHHDIKRWGRRGKSHRLLLGRAEQSYAWEAPRFVLRPGSMRATAHHRVYESLDVFIGCLDEYRP
jgi:hypothetical protein